MVSSIRDKKHCGKAKSKKRVLHLKKKIRPTDCSSKKRRRFKRCPRRLVSYKIGRGQARTIGSQVPNSTQGTPGAQGLQGPQGPQGVQGAQGPQGTYEVQAAGNYQGPIGPEGAQGFPGPVGPQGLSGPEGARGLPGPAGPQGHSGPEGTRGLPGPAGPQGLSGPEGAQGLPGPAGPQGLSGPEGAQGLPGPAGPQGPIGPPGEIPTITIIPTVYRYFYFPPSEIDSTVDIPVNQFTDDNGGAAAEFEGIGVNSYSNLYINGVLQEGSLYSLNEQLLRLFLDGDMLIAGTPIIVENVEFLARVA